jgi:hypothetical protein
MTRGLIVLALLAGGAVGVKALAARIAVPAIAGSATNGSPTARQDYPFIPGEGRFVMARIQFDFTGSRSMGRWGGNSCYGREPPWHHDFPYAEQNLTKIIRELTVVHPYTDGGNVFRLGDPRLFQFPVAYMSEPGCWSPDDEEITALRDYLLKGGLMIFDDFGGSNGAGQLASLNAQLRRALPDHQFVPLQPDSPIFDSFFLIDPATLNLQSYRGQIQFWGIYEDNDPRKRLMVIAGDEGDLGEFWEIRETGFYAIDLANEAYKVGVNYIVYAMTH